MAKLLVRFFTSKSLAVTLVGVLAFLAVVGTILPQPSRFGPAQLQFWQQRNPLISAVASPLGLFDVFASAPFWIAISLLFVNIVACTTKRYLQHQDTLFRLRPASIRVQGSLVLHVSLVIVFTGLMLSLGTRLDGKIVLTEGQGFEEAHESYASLSEGPFFGERHRAFRIVLKKFTPTYEQDKYLMDLISEVGVFDSGVLVDEVVVKTNQPLHLQSFIVTQDIYGFSPALTIRDRAGDVVVDAYVALKTFRGGRNFTFSDYLDLPPSTERRLVMTLYPDFAGDRESPRSRSDVLKTPALELDLQAKEGESLEKRLLLMGETATIGDFSYTFADLRYWSMFRVVRDPGLGILYAGFGLGFVGLVWRFVPDFFGRYLPGSVGSKMPAARVGAGARAVPLLEASRRRAESGRSGPEDGGAVGPAVGKRWRGSGIRKFYYWGRLRQDGWKRPGPRVGGDLSYSSSASEERRKPL